MIIKTPDIEIPTAGIYQSIILNNPSETKDDKIIFIDGITKEKLTYGEFKRNSKRLAAGLIVKTRFKRGYVIAIVSPNKVDYAVALFGTIAAGGKVTLVNPDNVVEEITCQLEDSGAKYIFTSLTCLSNVINAAAKANIPQSNIFLFGNKEERGIKPYVSLMSEREANPVEYSPEEVKSTTAYLCYSSGTTGKSKGVETTHYNVVANISQLNAYEDDIGSDSILIGVWPFFHIYGVLLLLHLILVKGATVILVPKFDLVSICEIVQNHKVNVIPITPSMILSLVSNDKITEQYDLSSLRFCMSAAAPLSQRLAEEFTEKFNIPVKQGYGLTEACVTHFVKTVKSKDLIPWSIGKAVPNIECKIVCSESGKELGYNQPGELLVRSPGIMKGYFNNQKATDECIDSEGWLHTGDLIRVDESGNFYIVDRIKELIKYDGKQVPPAELESILLTHPSIADAGVIGVKQEANEHPLAFVVLKENICQTDRLKESIKDFVDQKVADHKKLRGGVKFIDRIPRNASGKILRRLLRNRIQNSAPRECIMKKCLSKKMNNVSPLLGLVFVVIVFFAFINCLSCIINFLSFII